MSTKAVILDACFVRYEWMKIAATSTYPLCLLSWLFIPALQFQFQASDLGFESTDLISILSVLSVEAHSLLVAIDGAALGWIPGFTTPRIYCQKDHFRAS